MSETYPDSAVVQAVLSRFDAATQAVAVGVIVDGLDHLQVARALGVSRRTVARKLTRFLDMARQYVAMAFAAAAVTGCAGGVAVTDAPQRSFRAELQREALPTSPRADGEARARADVDPAARPEQAQAPAASSDLEFTAGLAEPPQQSVVPPAEAWTPTEDTDADATAKPVIDDVWPDKAVSSGGDKVVIRGKNLRAAQVLFGQSPASVLEATADQLTVAAPAAEAGKVAIVVTNRDGAYAIAGTPFSFYD